MAVLETHRAMTNGHGFSHKAGSFFHDVFAHLAQWNDMRATRKSLSQLTDRELDDIGLSRGDISLFR